MSRFTVRTSRFGALELEEAEIIRFPQGLPGFPDARRFVVLDHAREAPFQWLQSVDDAGLAFMIIDPLLVKSDYAMSLPEHAFADLHARDGDEFKVVVILTIPPGDPDKITANLQAPLVFNTANRCAKQLILVDQYTTRYPIAGSDSGTNAPTGPPRPNADSVEPRSPAVAPSACHGVV